MPDTDIEYAETPCPSGGSSGDGMHCKHWYDNPDGFCCFCGANAVLGKLEPTPGAVVIVRCDASVPQNGIEKIMEVTREAFPDNRILVLGPGANVSMVPEADLAYAVLGVLNERVPHRISSMPTHGAMGLSLNVARAVVERLMGERESGDGAPAA